MPLVKARIGAETLASLREKLERLKIPFGPLAKPDDLFDDPHLNQGERMLDVVLPTGAYAKLPGLPLDMDGRKPRLRRQPPVKVSTRAKCSKCPATCRRRSIGW